MESPDKTEGISSANTCATGCSPLQRLPIKTAARVLSHSDGIETRSSDASPCCQKKQRNDADTSAAPAAASTRTPGAADAHEIKKSTEVLRSPKLSKNCDDAGEEKHSEEQPQYSAAVDEPESYSAVDLNDAGSAAAATPRRFDLVQQISETQTGEVVSLLFASSESKHESSTQNSEWKSEFCHECSTAAVLARGSGAPSCACRSRFPSPPLKRGEKKDELLSVRTACLLATRDPASCTDDASGGDVVARDAPSLSVGSCCTSPDAAAAAAGHGSACVLSNREEEISAELTSLILEKRRRPVPVKPPLEKWLQRILESQPLQNVACPLVDVKETLSSTERWGGEATAELRRAMEERRDAETSHTAEPAATSGEADGHSRGAVKEQSCVQHLAGGNFEKRGTPGENECTTERRRTHYFEAREGCETAVASAFLSSHAAAIGAASVPPTTAVPFSSSLAAAYPIAAPAFDATASSRAGTYSGARAPATDAAFLSGGNSLADAAPSASFTVAAAAAPPVSACRGQLQQCFCLHSSQQLVGSVSSEEAPLSYVAVSSGPLQCAEQLFTEQQQSRRHPSSPRLRQRSAEEQQQQQDCALHSQETLRSWLQQACREDLPPPQQRWHSPSAVDAAASSRQRNCLFQAGTAQQPDSALQQQQQLCRPHPPAASPEHVATVLRTLRLHCSSCSRRGISPTGCCCHGSFFCVNHDSGGAAAATSLDPFTTKDLRKLSIRETTTCSMQTTAGGRCCSRFSVGDKEAAKAFAAADAPAADAWGLPLGAGAAAAKKEVASAERPSRHVATTPHSTAARCSSQNSVSRAAAAADPPQRPVIGSRLVTREELPLLCGPVFDGSSAEEQQQDKDEKQQQERGRRRTAAAAENEADGGEGGTSGKRSCLLLDDVPVTGLPGSSLADFIQAVEKMVRASCQRSCKSSSSDDNAKESSSKDSSTGRSTKGSSTARSSSDVKDSCCCSSKNSSSTTARRRSSSSSTQNSSSSAHYSSGSNCSDSGGKTGLREGEEAGDGETKDGRREATLRECRAAAAESVDHEALQKLSNKEGKEERLHKEDEAAAALPAPETELSLVSCSCCRRKFVDARIQRHMQACVKAREGRLLLLRRLRLKRQQQQQQHQHHRTQQQTEQHSVSRLKKPQQQLGKKKEEEPQQQLGKKEEDRQRQRRRGRELQQRPEQKRSTDQQQLVDKEQQQKKKQQRRGGRENQQQQQCGRREQQLQEQGRGREPAERHGAGVAVGSRMQQHFSKNSTETADINSSSQAAQRVHTSDRSGSSSRMPLHCKKNQQIPSAAGAPTATPAAADQQRKSSGVRAAAAAALPSATSAPAAQGPAASLLPPAAAAATAAAAAAAAEAGPVAAAAATLVSKSAALALQQIGGACIGAQELQQVEDRSRGPQRQQQQLRNESARWAQQQARWEGEEPSRRGSNTQQQQQRHADEDDARRAVHAGKMQQQRYGVSQQQQLQAQERPLQQLLTSSTPDAAGQPQQEEVYTRGETKQKQQQHRQQEEGRGGATKKFRDSSAAAAEAAAPMTKTTHATTGEAASTRPHIAAAAAAPTEAATAAAERRDTTAGEAATATDTAAEAATTAAVPPPPAAASHESAEKTAATKTTARKAAGAASTERQSASLSHQRTPQSAAAALNCSAETSRYAADQPAVPLHVAVVETHSLPSATQAALGGTAPAAGEPAEAAGGAPAQQQQEQHERQLHSHLQQNQLLQHQENQPLQQQPNQQPHQQKGGEQEQQALQKQQVTCAQQGEKNETAASYKLKRQSMPLSPLTVNLETPISAASAKPHGGEPVAAADCTSAAAAEKGVAAAGTFSTILQRETVAACCPRLLAATAAAAQPRQGLLNSSSNRNAAMATVATDAGAAAASISAAAAVGTTCRGRRVQLLSVALDDNEESLAAAAALAAAPVQQWGVHTPAAEVEEVTLPAAASFVSSSSGTVRGLVQNLAQHIKTKKISTEATTIAAPAGAATPGAAAAAAGPAHRDVTSTAEKEEAAARSEEEKEAAAAPTEAAALTGDAANAEGRTESTHGRWEARAETTAEAALCSRSSDALAIISAAQAGNEPAGKSKAAAAPSAVVQRGDFFEDEVAAAASFGAAGTARAAGAAAAAVVPSAATATPRNEAVDLAADAAAATKQHCSGKDSATAEAARGASEGRAAADDAAGVGGLAVAADEGTHCTASAAAAPAPAASGEAGAAQSSSAVAEAAAAKPCVPSTPSAAPQHAGERQQQQPSTKQAQQQRARQQQQKHRGTAVQGEEQRRQQRQERGGLASSRRGRQGDCSSGKAVRLEEVAERGGIYKGTRPEQRWRLQPCDTCAFCQRSFCLKSFDNHVQVCKMLRAARTLLPQSSSFSANKRKNAKAPPNKLRATSPVHSLTPAADAAIASLAAPAAAAVRQTQRKDSSSAPSAAKEAGAAVPRPPRYTAAPPQNSEKEILLASAAVASAAVGSSCAVPPITAAAAAPRQPLPTSSGAFSCSGRRHRLAAAAAAALTRSDGMEGSALPPCHVASWIAAALSASSVDAAADCAQIVARAPAGSTAAARATAAAGAFEAVRTAAADRGESQQAEAVAEGLDLQALEWYQCLFTAAAAAAIARRQQHLHATGAEQQRERPSGAAAAAESLLAVLLQNTAATREGKAHCAAAAAAHASTSIREWECDELAALEDHVQQQQRRCLLNVMHAQRCRARQQRKEALCMHSNGRNSARNRKTAWMSLPTDQTAASAPLLSGIDCCSCFCPETTLYSRLKKLLQQLEQQQQQRQPQENLMETSRAAAVARTTMPPAATAIAANSKTLRSNRGSPGKPQQRRAEDNKTGHEKDANAAKYPSQKQCSRRSTSLEPLRHLRAAYAVESSWLHHTRSRTCSGDRTSGALPPAAIASPASQLQRQQQQQTATQQQALLLERRRVRQEQEQQQLSQERCCRQQQQQLSERERQQSVEQSQQQLQQQRRQQECPAQGFVASLREIFERKPPAARGEEVRVSRCQAQQQKQEPPQTQACSAAGTAATPARSAVAPVRAAAHPRLERDRLHSSSHSEKSSSSFEEEMLLDSLPSPLRLDGAAGLDEWLLEQQQRQEHQQQQEQQPHEQQRLLFSSRVDRGNLKRSGFWDTFSYCQNSQESPDVCVNDLSSPQNSRSSALPPAAAASASRNKSSSVDNFSASALGVIDVAPFAVASSAATSAAARTPAFTAAAPVAAFQVAAPPLENIRRPLAAQQVAAAAAGNCLSANLHPYDRCLRYAGANFYSSSSLPPSLPADAAVASSSLPPASFLATAEAAAGPRHAGFPQQPQQALPQGRNGEPSCCDCGQVQPGSSSSTRSNGGVLCNETLSSSARERSSSSIDHTGRSSSSNAGGSSSSGRTGSSRSSFEGENSSSSSRGRAASRQASAAAVSSSGGLTRLQEEASLHHCSRFERKRRNSYAPQLLPRDASLPHGRLLHCEAPACRRSFEQPHILRHHCLQDFAAGTSSAEQRQSEVRGETDNPHTYHSRASEDFRPQSGSSTTQQQQRQWQQQRWWGREQHQLLPAVAFGERSDGWERQPARIAADFSEGPASQSSTVVCTPQDVKQFALLRQLQQHRPRRSSRSSSSGGQEQLREGASSSSAAKAAAPLLLLQQPEEGHRHHHHYQNDGPAGSSSGRCSTFQVRQDAPSRPVIDLDALLLQARTARRRRAAERSGSCSSSSSASQQQHRPRRIISNSSPSSPGLQEPQSSGRGKPLQHRGPSPVDDGHQLLQRGQANPTEQPQQQRRRLLLQRPSAAVVAQTLQPELSFGQQQLQQPPAVRRWLWWRQHQQQHEKTSAGDKQQQQPRAPKQCLQQKEKALGEYCHSQNVHRGRQQDARAAVDHLPHPVAAATRHLQGSSVNAAAATAAEWQLASSQWRLPWMYVADLGPAATALEGAAAARGLSAYHQSPGPPPLLLPDAARSTAPAFAASYRSRSGTRVRRSLSSSGSSTNGSCKRSVLKKSRNDGGVLRPCSADGGSASPQLLLQNGSSNAFLPSARRLCSGGGAATRSSSAATAPAPALQDPGASVSGGRTTAADAQVSQQESTLTLQQRYRERDSPAPTRHCENLSLSCKTAAAASEIRVTSGSGSGPWNSSCSRSSGLPTHHVGQTCNRSYCNSNGDRAAQLTPLAATQREARRRSADAMRVNDCSTWVPCGCEGSKARGDSPLQQQARSPGSAGAATLHLKKLPQGSCLPSVPTVGCPPSSSPYSAAAGGWQPAARGRRAAGAQGLSGGAAAAENVASAAAPASTGAVAAGRGLLTRNQYLEAAVVAVVPPAAAVQQKAVEASYSSTIQRGAAVVGREKAAAAHLPGNSVSGGPFRAELPFHPSSSDAHMPFLEKDAGGKEGQEDACGLGQQHLHLRFRKDVASSCQPTAAVCREGECREYFFGTARQQACRSPHAVPWYLSGAALDGVSAGEKAAVTPATRRQPALPGGVSGESSSRPKPSHLACFSSSCFAVIGAPYCSSAAEPRDCCPAGKSSCVVTASSSGSENTSGAPSSLAGAARPEVPPVSFFGEKLVANLGTAAAACAAEDGAAVPYHVSDESAFCADVGDGERAESKLAAGACEVNLRRETRQSFLDKTRDLAVVAQQQRKRPTAFTAAGGKAMHRPATANARNLLIAAQRPSHCGPASSYQILAARLPVHSSWSDVGESEEEIGATASQEQGSFCNASVAHAIEGAAVQRHRRRGPYEGIVKENGIFLSLPHCRSHAKRQNDETQEPAQRHRSAAADAERTHREQQQTFGGYNTEVTRRFPCSAALPPAAFLPSTEEEGGLGAGGRGGEATGTTCAVGRSRTLAIQSASATPVFASAEMQGLDNTVSVPRQNEPDSPAAAVSNGWGSPTAGVYTSFARRDTCFVSSSMSADAEPQLPVLHKAARTAATGEAIPPPRLASARSRSLDAAAARVSWAPLEAAATNLQSTEWRESLCNKALFLSERRRRALFTGKPEGKYMSNAAHPFADSYTVNVDFSCAPAAAPPVDMQAVAAELPQTIMGSEMNSVESGGLYCSSATTTARSSLQTPATMCLQRQQHCPVSPARESDFSVGRPGQRGREAASEKTSPAADAGTATMLRLPETHPCNQNTAVSVSVQKAHQQYAQGAAAHGATPSKVLLAHSGVLRPGVAALRGHAAAATQDKHFGTAPWAAAAGCSPRRAGATSPPLLRQLRDDTAREPPFLENSRDLSRGSCASLMVEDDMSTSPSCVNSVVAAAAAPAAGGHADTGHVPTCKPSENTRGACTATPAAVTQQMCSGSPAPSVGGASATSSGYLSFKDSPPCAMVQDAVYQGSPRSDTCSSQQQNVSSGPRQQLAELRLQAVCPCAGARPEQPCHPPTHQQDLKQRLVAADLQRNWIYGCSLGSICYARPGHGCRDEATGSLTPAEANATAGNRAASKLESSIAVTNLAVVQPSHFPSEPAAASAAPDGHAHQIHFQQTGGLPGPVTSYFSNFATATETQKVCQHRSQLPETAELPPSRHYVQQP